MLYRYDADSDIYGAQCVPFGLTALTDKFEPFEVRVVSRYHQREIPEHWKLTIPAKVRFASKKLFDERFPYDGAVQFFEQCSLMRWGPVLHFLCFGNASEEYITDYQLKCVNNTFDEANFIPLKEFLK